MKDLRIILKIKNNLILKRAEELWGHEISQGKIEENIGLSQGSLSAFLNFSQNPLKAIKKRGKIVTYEWRSIPLKIADALGVEPEDIFPEHLRESRRNKYEFEIQSERLIENLQNDPEEIVFKNEIKEHLHNALSLITPREQEILKLRFGLLGEDPMTLEEIGGKFDLSKERIRRIEQKALARLRNPSLWRKR